MKIYVAGDSHLTHYTKIGAAFRGLHITNAVQEADLILIAEDMPTDEQGNRVTGHIENFVHQYRKQDKPIILMSQVAPGFCRRQGYANLYHYPETLRIKDSYERACHPDYIILGSDGSLCDEVVDYASAFKCPQYHMFYEDAEFAKIAVNTALASQVDYANLMSAACKKLGADWNTVSEAIKNDKRIGQHAYLTPGRWQDSLHLLRDSVTLKEIEDAR